MVAREALALPQLQLRPTAELAAVVVASKQERVCDLATEAARNVDEANQADNGGTGHRHAFRVDWRALRLHDLGLAVDNQPQRPAHGYHGQWFERGVEG